MVFHLIFGFAITRRWFPGEANHAHGCVSGREVRLPRPLHSLAIARARDGVYSRVAFRAGFARRNASDSWVWGEVAVLERRLRFAWRAGADRRIERHSVKELRFAVGWAAMGW